MFHRHPFLSIASCAYLGLLGWVTLTPAANAPIPLALAARILDALHRRGYFLMIDMNRLEFLANIALFVPVGVFLLLLVGSERWWLAMVGPFFVTAFIETMQRGIPGRVPDERDLLANTLGGIAGVIVAMGLTLPGTLRRRRRRRGRQAAAYS